MELYHGSSVAGLTELLPQLSKDQLVVYATADWILALIFAGRNYGPRGGLGMWIEDGYVAIKEGEEGGIIEAMLDYHGPVSIYSVSAEWFDGTSNWDGEVYSEQNVPVDEEEVVDDFGDLFHDLLVEGRIRIVDTEP